MQSMQAKHGTFTPEKFPRVSAGFSNQYKFYCRSAQQSRVYNCILACWVNTRVPKFIGRPLQFQVTLGLF